MKPYTLFLVTLFLPFSSVYAQISVSPYLGASDSPYADIDFDYFHLENMEDGVNEPGLVAEGGFIIDGGNPNVDSVDEDDGAIDGSGSDGASYATIRPNPDALFTFSIEVLGELPTHAGVVWTDGGSDNTGTATSFTFQFFGENNNLLDQTTLNLGDNQLTGQTTEDRFVGLVNLSGIASIRVFNNTPQNGYIELDHVQYGAVESAADPPLAGDFDLDGDVDADDIDFYSGNLGLASTGDLAQLDLDEDDLVTLADHDLHVTTLVETSNGRTGSLLGDINLDGSVDVLNDAFALVSGLGGSTGGYANGDLNADGVINVLDDAFRLIANLGQTNDPS